MAITPLITSADLKARYGQIILRAGITSTDVLDDIANGAIDEIKKAVGYNPQVDSVTGLPQVKEKLDGGRSFVVLKAPVDTESEGAVLTVYELGHLLTPRLSWPTDGSAPTGDYILDDSTYMLMRLASPGARVPGIWGASTNSAVGVGYFGSEVIGGPRLGGDYTDNYRGVVEVTYTPDIGLALFKQVAMELARLGILATKPDSDISDGDQSVSVGLGVATDFETERLAQLKRLPIAMHLDTGR